MWLLQRRFRLLLEKLEKWSIFWVFSRRWTDRHVSRRKKHGYLRLRPAVPLMEGVNHGYLHKLKSAANQGGTTFWLLETCELRALEYSGKQGCITRWSMDYGVVPLGGRSLGLFTSCLWWRWCLLTGGGWHILWAYSAFPNRVGVSKMLDRLLGYRCFSSWGGKRVVPAVCSSHALSVSGNLFTDGAEVCTDFVHPDSQWVIADARREAGVLQHEGCFVNISFASSLHSSPVLAGCCLSRNIYPPMSKI
jgi:hypothetical protein